MKKPVLCTVSCPNGHVVMTIADLLEGILDALNGFTVFCPSCGVVMFSVDSI